MSDNVGKQKRGKVTEKTFFARRDIFLLTFTAMATYIIMLLYVRKEYQL
jgi:hypothetical protein